MAAKDETISALRAEVAYLRRVLQPSAARSASVSLEADLAIGGHENQVNPDPLPEDPKVAALNSEAARLLSGNY